MNITRYNIIGFAVILCFMFSSFASANSDILIFNADHKNQLVIHGGTGEDFSLYFGDSLSQALLWDESLNSFSFTNDVSFSDNEIKDVRLENLATAPVCDSSVVGKIYYNTTDLQSYTCDGTLWKSSGASLSILYGAVSPSVVGNEAEGDEYFLTSDGTSSGVILEEWVFDGSAWVLRPVDSGTVAGLISEFGSSDTQNINVSNAIIEFPNTLLNNAGFTSSGTTFTANASGTYQLLINGRVETLAIRTNPTFELYINGLGQNVFSSNLYIRKASGNDHASTTFSWNVDLVAGDSVSFRAIVDGAGGTVRWTGVNEGKLQIMRIR